MIRKLVLFAFLINPVLLLAAPPTMDEIRPYLDEIKLITSMEQPFYMFPEESNGIYEYRRIRPLDCAEISFRDSIGLRKTNGYFSFFRATRVVSLYDVEYVNLVDSQPTESDVKHYTVQFGAKFKDIAKLIYVETEDERGVRKQADSFVPSLTMRYGSQEAAEKVHLAMQKLVALCQRK